MRDADGYMYGVGWGSQIPYTYVRMPSSEAGSLIFEMEAIKRAAKRANGPKESKMEKKTFEWCGEEMHEADRHNFVSLMSNQKTVNWLEALAVHGATREQLYANAVKAGCVEVVRPKPCPCCASQVKIMTTPSGNSVVECVVCGMCGPEMLGKSEAVKAWNRIEVRS